MWVVEKANTRWSYYGLEVVKETYKWDLEVLGLVYKSKTFARASSSRCKREELQNAGQCERLCKCNVPCIPFIQTYAKSIRKKKSVKQVDHLHLLKSYKTSCIFHWTTVGVMKLPKCSLLIMYIWGSFYYTYTRLNNIVPTGIANQKYKGNKLGLSCAKLRWS